MPTWVVVVVTVVVSLASACGFLILRCRGIGNPFGRRARWWAVTVIVVTAGVSNRRRPGGHRGGRSRHRGLRRPDPAQQPVDGPGGPGLRWPGAHGVVALATFPLRRLDDLMGEDMQEWCDERLRAAARKPQWLSTRRSTTSTRSGTP